MNQVILGACGLGRGGALAVIHRFLSPDVITEVDLPGCQGMWAVSDVGLWPADGSSEYDFTSLMSILVF